MGESVDQLLLAILSEDDEAAELIINQLQAEDEPVLTDLATSSDLDQRWWAMRALAQIGTSSSIHVLKEALTDTLADIRTVAALALAHIHRREPEAVQPVLSQIVTLFADEDGIVRQVAADALSLCGDDAVESLGIALNHTQDAVRVRAAYALRKIATMRAAPYLYQHLNDPNYLVRTYAYEALDEMGLLENVLVTV